MKNYGQGTAGGKVPLKIGNTKRACKANPKGAKPAKAKPAKTGSTQEY